MQSRRLFFVARGSGRIAVERQLQPEIPRHRTKEKVMPQLKHFAVGQKENEKCFAVESSEHGIQSQSSPAVTADYVQSVCQIWEMQRKKSIQICCKPEEFEASEIEDPTGATKRPAEMQDWEHMGAIWARNITEFCFFVFACFQVRDFLFSFVQFLCSSWSRVCDLWLSFLRWQKDSEDRPKKVRKRRARKTRCTRKRCHIGQHWHHWLDHPLDSAHQRWSQDTSSFMVFWNFCCGAHGAHGAHGISLDVTVTEHTVSFRILFRTVLEASSHGIGSRSRARQSGLEGTYRRIFEPKNWIQVTKCSFVTLFLFNPNWIVLNAQFPELSLWWRDIKRQRDVE